LQHPGDARGLAEPRFDHGFHGIPIPRNIRRSGNSLENRERISLRQAELREDSMMAISGTLPPPRGYLSAMSNTTNSQRDRYVQKRSHLADSGCIREWKEQTMRQRGSNDEQRPSTRFIDCEVAGAHLVASANDFDGKALSHPLIANPYRSMLLIRCLPDQNTQYV